MGNKSVAKLQPNDLITYRRQTSFTDQEIEEWFKCFHKDCPNGVLMLADFQKIYAQFFPYGNSSKFAEYVFNRFDTNCDNKITFQEFLMALNVTAKGNVDEKLDWAFGLYDLDHDGYISQREMFDIVKSIYDMVGTIMPMPEDESTPEKRTKKIFDTFDTDRDGRLSRTEFIRGAQSDPSIVQILSGDRTEAFASGRLHSSQHTTSMTRLNT